MAVRSGLASRRLPGFRFEAQAPPLADVLPRMDVAVFVGFAASGPLHRPVAVEDVAQFQSIFGDDVLLAWDEERNEQVYGHLGSAVRAFFRNGGRRCWIVRVAGSIHSHQPQYNYLPVPGLAQVDALGRITPAFARTRSEGSWSDGLRVSSALLSLPITVASFTDYSIYGEGYIEADLVLASPGDVVEGDLLRLSFPQQQAAALCIVQAVKMPKPNGKSSPNQAPQAGGATGVAGATHVVCVPACWLVPVAQHAVLPAQAVLFGYTAGEGVSEQEVPLLSYEVSSQQVTVELGISPAQAPEIGSFVRLDVDGVGGSGARSVLVQVQSVYAGYTYTSPLTSPLIETVTIAGAGFALSPEAPVLPPSALPVGERLTFELWAQESSSPGGRLNGGLFRLSDLAFGAQHPRFWGALPTDKQLYSSIVAPSSLTPVSLWQTRPPDRDNTALWQDASTPRFPLAGNEAAGTGTGGAGDAGAPRLYLPVGMAALPQQYLPIAIQPADPIVRDGLDCFEASLFVDERMADARVSEILQRAEYLRSSLDESGAYIASQQDVRQGTQESEEQPLRGIHAALDIEEATLIAVPDAIQRGWELSAVPDAPPVQDVPVPTETGAEETASQSAAMPMFIACYQPFVQTPRLFAVHPPDELGTFTLGWEQVSGGEQGEQRETIYTLQEATSEAYPDAVSIYTGQDGETILYEHPHGRYFYRVRAEVNGLVSAWSNGIAVSIQQSRNWRLKAQNDAGGEDAATLLAVQRALLRLCAARGDICALLALPESYQDEQVFGHIASLKALVDTVPPTEVPPLGSGEAMAYSYGALYHPWLFALDDQLPGAVDRVPPDGAICGVIAQRAINRGAWVAPANIPLLDTVGLTPDIRRTNWQRLQDLQVNLIRQEPRGFLALNADTLSQDEDLRPFNVRRLLILLRRMALREGMTYVFEPNNAAFRRKVERSFEEMLELLFLRGAFAGDTSATSFQVVVDQSLNTPQQADQGRFLVELKVAPSLPLTFLTVRLVLQSSGGATITEVS